MSLSGCLLAFSKRFRFILALHTLTHMIYLCVCVSSVSFWPSVLKITITIIIIIAGVIIEMLFGEKCELWWISSVAGEVDFWTSIISWFSPATHKPSTLKSIHQWLKSVKLSLTSTRVPTFRRRRRRRPSQTLNAYFLGGTYDNNSIVERGSNGGGGGETLTSDGGGHRETEREKKSAMRNCSNTQISMESKTARNAPPSAWWRHWVRFGALTGREKRVWGRWKQLTIAWADAK